MNNKVECYKKGEEATLPLLTITPAELDTMTLEHTGGGFGWAMVEDIDREFCRVAPVSKDGLQNRAYLAWKPRLRVAVQDGTRVPLSPKALEDARKIRAEFKSGKRRVEAAYMTEIA